MATLQIAHTAELDAAALKAARELLAGIFEASPDSPDGTDASDWEHCLGGMHILLYEGEELIGHTSVVQRRLLHGGRAMRTGYLEGVGVRADRRGRGHGGTLLEAAERVVRGGYELGALSSTDAALDFYAGRGWQRWQGTTWALTPAGIVRTPEEDEAVFVLPGSAPLRLSGEITCDWRDGDVW
jgi:aminoglycoside 2'-N-acetyltransferase I